MARMTAAEFARSPAANFNHAADVEAISVTRHGTPYAVVVSAQAWNEADQARAVLEGMKRLARSGADCTQYQAFAEWLCDLEDQGYGIDSSEVTPASH